MTFSGQLALAIDPEALSSERRRWKANAVRLHFGVCESCHRHHDDDGKPLMVARQARAQRFLCFDCFSGPLRRQRPTSVRVSQ